jgi:ABC-type transporter Mla MlaB component
MELADVAVAVRPGEHACCRLAHDHDRERLARAFVVAGLERGDKVLYITDHDDLGERGAQLTAGDDMLAAALDSGQFVVRLARDAYTPGGRFEPKRMLAEIRDEHARALAAGHRGLSVTGEMTWALAQAVAPEDLTAYERSFADQASDTLAVFCQYDHGRFGTGLLTDIATSHQVDVSPELAAIGREGCLAAARVGATLRLCGELDFGTADALAGVLGAHFHGPLELDLGDVTFVDVAGMRALRGRTAQPLKIMSASAQVQRLLSLLAWDTDPAIEVLAA